MSSLSSDKNVHPASVEKPNRRPYTPGTTTSITTYLENLLFNHLGEAVVCGGEGVSCVQTRDSRFRCYYSERTPSDRERTHEASLFEVCLRPRSKNFRGPLSGKTRLTYANKSRSWGRPEKRDRVKKVVL